MKSAAGIWRNIALVLAGAILFSCAHPGFIFSRGLCFLGFLALLPVFIITRKESFKVVWLWGFAYGMISYALYCYWLVRYAFVVYVITIIVYGIFLSIVFEAMHFCFYFYSKKNKLIGYFAASLVWCIYEYVKTCGFLGFSYGIIGYTQWTNIPLLQASAFGGVWILSLLCALYSASIAYCAEQCVQKKSFKQIKAYIPFGTMALIGGVLFWYGIFACKKSEEGCRPVKIICVQNDTDPWKSGVDFYKRDIDVLKSLTDDALAHNEDAQFVVWPESAVVPSILYNYKEKRDYSRYQLVTGVLDYFNSKKCVFVIGNQQSEDTGKKYTDDYNAVLVFDAQKESIVPPNPGIYRKMHLVPFTEYFPYQRLFPRLYKILLNGDTHLWEPGKDPVVFTNRNIRFSTPICFEDTFGDVCRKFVEQHHDGTKGAQLLLNVSNDAWAHSEGCQNQHAAMAVVRCAENGVPAARSTASGLTCIVDRTGRIVAEADSFKRQAICARVEVPTEGQVTCYTRYGDMVPLGEMIILFILIILSISKRVVENKRENGVQ